MSGCMGTAYNKTGAVLTGLTGDLLKALEEQQRAAQENAKANADAQCAMAQGSAASQVTAGEKEAQSLEKEASMASVSAGMQVASAVMSTAVLAKTMKSSNNLMTQMRHNEANGELLSKTRAGADGVVLGGVGEAAYNHDSAKASIKSGEKLGSLAGANEAQLAELKSEAKLKHTELERAFKHLDQMHQTLEQWSGVVRASDGFNKAYQQKMQAELKRETAAANATAELYRGAANPADRETGEAIARIKDKQRQIGEVIQSLNEAKKGANDYRA